MEYEFLEQFLTEEWPVQQSLQPIIYNNKYIARHLDERLPFYRSRIDLALNDYGNLIGKTVVDMGCNVGFDSIEAARRGATVTSVDMIKRLLEVVQFSAKSIGLELNTVHSTFAKFILTHLFKRYDVILAFHVITYSKVAGQKWLLDLFLNMGKTTYIDLSPEPKYEPFNMFMRKKFQEKTLYKFCNDYLKNYKILESDYAYIIKVIK